VGGEQILATNQVMGRYLYPKLNVAIEHTRRVCTNLRAVGRGARSSIGESLAMGETHFLLTQKTSENVGLVCSWPEGAIIKRTQCLVNEK